MENISYTPATGVDGKSFAALVKVFTHYFTFNEEGKIINAGDFGDATGM